MDLNIAYENGAFIPGSETFAEDMELAAADWRQVEAAVGRARLNLPYGTGARQAMDIFYPSGKPEGLVFFIHGGYWRRFDRKAWSHLAAGATARGWAVAMPSYTLTPQVSISDITQEMVTALGIAADLVAGPIAVTGHSAGGHLAARLICDGVGVPDSVTERIRTCVPISGLFDLRPLIETDMNEDFGLDMAAAKAESPIFHRPLATPRTTVWVGAEERPVFLDQSRWLAKAWPDAALRIATGRHHFDVIDALSEPESPLMGDILGRV